MSKAQPSASNQPQLIRILGAAERMARLINDLLAYARAGGQPLAMKPVDCGRVVAEAQLLLGASIEQAGATIQHSALPTVCGDEGQLLQVFQNLLDNAIKFRSAARAPIIVIQGEMVDAEWVIRVRDNGIGIPSNHTERVFDLFQRLHGPQNGSGTGIGLALCKRIVERHGGRIWVDSAPDGTSMVFTLPAVPATPSHH
jgi:signal transduction histidine kinase